jgi:hypothetical protein
MGFRFAIIAAASTLILASAPTKARACGESGGAFWVGTTTGLTSRLDGPIRPGGLIGAEFGLSTYIHAYEKGRCPLLGLGAKLIYSGSWMAALPLRVSYVILSNNDLPSLYLQGGPAFHWGIPGVDVEAGLDWIFGAVFIGTTWLPDGSERGTTVMIGGRISLLFCAWLLACWSSGHGCSPG